MFHAPRKGRFGEVPPADEALLDAYLEGTPYVVTGPTVWNALRLGTTALAAHPLVYNTKRSGIVSVGGRTFHLRRVAFPVDPPAEWFVVDLLQNADAAAAAADELQSALTQALKARRFDADVLTDMAMRYGRRAEVDAVLRAVRAAS